MSLATQQIAKKRKGKKGQKLARILYEDEDDDNFQVNTAPTKKSNRIYIIMILLNILLFIRENK